MVARSLGTPVERYAIGSRLSLEMLQHPATLVPQIPVWRFVEKMSRQEGLALLGLHMNEALTAIDVKTVNPFLASSSNLYTLLKRFCGSIPMQTNVARYVPVEEGDLVWVRIHQQMPSHAPDQVELFQLVTVISAVQSVLGASWRPLAIEFKCVKPIIEIAHSEALNPCRHHFGCAIPGVAIPRMDVAALLNRDPTNSNSGLDKSDLGTMPDSYSSQVMTAVSAMLGNCVPNVARIEDITNLSLRNLQRKLQQEGTSFRELLEQARLERAHSLLSETVIPVTEISNMLGYSNPPAFSRSFKNWSAVTPKMYRQLQRTG